MESVFRNLISNSIRAMENEINKKLFINARVIEDKVVINIGDTGYGMDEETRENLFKPSTKFNGMGRYITRKFVEDHHGKVYVESSTPGLATIITIELPKYS